MSLKEKIVESLKRKSGQFAKEIACELGVDRSEVNSVLYKQLQGVAIQGIRNKKERELLDLFVSEMRVFSITGDIAIKAGLLKREYGKSHSSGLADCIIAATAMSQGMKLATLNIKHFPMIDTVFAPYKKS